MASFPAIHKQEVPCSSAEKLQAEMKAGRETKDCLDSNLRPARLADESLGACPGDLPSWSDAAEDPYLLFLQLMMVAKGHSRRQTQVSTATAEQALPQLKHCSNNCYT